jgi:hypothetical protein
MGVVGCARKRTLMLWRAVEICRRGDYHDAVALDIARRALEPPPDAQVGFSPGTETPQSGEQTQVSVQEQTQLSQDIKTLFSGGARASLFVHYLSQPCPFRQPPSR